ncbi:39S ribosomal protein L32, mitochondrial [Tachyglossus aculeatus]|uniref:39S ribosomal protein L32, mitochondrial n=1 Tax=Tachyglossus aculeatus TaxID=9261 RepID=UPI0018F29213|nr:39S ribosomal protein L32, mitochondrial [Tachyglossus aculeatus]
MASVLLMVPSAWAARGLLGRLRNCWEILEKSLLFRLPGSPPCGPALAVEGPAAFLQPPVSSESSETPSVFDSTFWMAAPKNRRTIEVNRCRRRNPRNLIKVKDNIEVCPECDRPKLKQVLCGYCYEKVRQETVQIRMQIGREEGGPFKAPAVETVVLYQGEEPSEQDQGKRIIKQDRKRPSWFAKN